MTNNNTPRSDDDNDDESDVESLMRKASLALCHQVTFALNDLPILARLEFARNLLQSNGGDKDSLPQKAELVIALDVIGDVIKVLEKRPPAGTLRTTNPKLG